MHTFKLRLFVPAQFYMNITFTSFYIDHNVFGKCSSGQILVEEVRKHGPYCGYFSVPSIFTKSSQALILLKFIDGRHIHVSFSVQVYDKHREHQVQHHSAHRLGPFYRLKKMDVLSLNSLMPASTYVKSRTWLFHVLTFHDQNLHLTFDCHLYKHSSQRLLKPLSLI